MLEIALDCIRRGWHVFPCRPKSKQPATLNGFKAATLDENQVREWWTATPDANVAIATGPSGLCVVDVDAGIKTNEDFTAWAGVKGLPETYTVATGRTDGLGLQLYFEGRDLRSVPWKDGDVAGDIRCSTGYVMAAGCVHPSGNPYRVVKDAPVARVPAYVRTLKPERGHGVVDDGAPITSSRNNALTSIAGKMRNTGMSTEALEAALLQTNADRCVPPLEDEEVRRIAANASAWRAPTVDPVVTLGGV